MDAGSVDEGVSELTKTTVEEGPAEVVSSAETVAGTVEVVLSMLDTGLDAADAIDEKADVAL